MEAEVGIVNMIDDDETETSETESVSEDIEAAIDKAEEELAAEESAQGQTASEEQSDEEAPSNVTQLPQAGPQHMRMLEAMLFASARPLSEKELAERMPKGIDVKVLLEELAETYEKRGVVLDKVADKWLFRTASDLNYLFQREAVEPKKLSKAAIETLSIIAYHQPVTRAEIEDIRGVTVSKGTLDLLLELGWIRLRGRRRTPGRPITYGTTADFLEHFGLENVRDLPGLEDLKAAGMLEANIPAGFSVPEPSDELTDEEDPLEEEDLNGDLLAELDEAPSDEEVAAAEAQLDEVPSESLSEVAEEAEDTEEEPREN